jgi:hypothetical protein
MHLFCCTIGYMVSPPTSPGNSARVQSLGRNLLIILCVLFLSACTTEVQIPDQVPLTQEPEIPTATPFQPQSGTFNSPYESPAPIPSSYSTLFAPGRLPNGQFNLSTPDTSGASDQPIFYTSAGVNPLTGLIVSTPQLLERRPLAIKITQYPRYVRPQSGLTLADVVFEYYIEDGLTRFIAIFYGNNSARVGPVRSGRYFDEHIVRMYQAFYVFKYADPRVYNFFKESDLARYLVVPGNGACPPFVIGSEARDTYNNIFLNTTKFNDCIAKRAGVDNDRPALHSSFFSFLPPSSNEIANKIYTQYSTDDYNYWEYLPADNRYVRYQEVDDQRHEKPPSYALLTDDVTKFPVKADNVVVLFVPHVFATKNEAEDEVYHIDLAGSGNAYVFRNGVALKASWSRKLLNQPLILTSEQGTPIYLQPGVTFYQIIGVSSESWHDSTSWHFIFDTP